MWGHGVINLYSSLGRGLSLRISEERALPHFSLALPLSSCHCLGASLFHSLFCSCVASDPASVIWDTHSLSIHHSASDFFLKWKCCLIMAPVAYEVKSVLCTCHTQTLLSEPDGLGSSVSSRTPPAQVLQCSRIRRCSMFPFCLEIFATVALDWHPVLHLETFGSCLKHHFSEVFSKAIPLFTFSPSPLVLKEGASLIYLCIL